MKITWLVTKKNLLNLLWVIWDGALPELRVRIAYICIRAGDGPWVSDPAGQLHQQRRFLMKPFRAWNNSLSNGLIKQLAKIHQEVHVKKKKKIQWDWTCRSFCAIKGSECNVRTVHPIQAPAAENWASCILSFVDMTGSLCGFLPAFIKQQTENDVRRSARWAATASQTHLNENLTQSKHLQWL